MVLPANYTPALTDASRAKNFPNLQIGQNFKITSLKTDDYNCVAWALKIDDDWIQYDVDVNEYINHFSALGFVPTKNIDVIHGVEKIAIYVNDISQFTHVARQLKSGAWASKLGDWEDIEHDTLEAIAGDFYGHPFIIMQK